MEAEHGPPPSEYDYRGEKWRADARFGYRCDRLRRFMAIPRATNQPNDESGRNTIRELVKLHKWGAETLRHSSQPSGLKHLDTAAGARAGGDLWAFVKEACLLIDEPFAQAALAFFGYEYEAAEAQAAGQHVKSTPGKWPTNRRNAAASAIPCSGRTFDRELKKRRRYGGGESFKTYRELVLHVSAKAVLASAKGCLAEPPQAEAGKAVAPGATALIDTYEYHRETSFESFQDGFFQRLSTQQYIEDIAQCVVPGNAVTIFAGAGASADIAEPLPSGFMEQLLIRTLGESSILQDEINGQERVVLIDSVANAISASYPATYLGSAVRELVSRPLGSAAMDIAEEREEKLRNEINEIVQAGHVPGEFLARAIAMCTFAMRQAKASVVVLTTSFDKALEKAAEHAKKPKYLPSALRAYDFVTITSRPDTVLEAKPQQVPVVHVNGTTGTSGESLVIGEGEVFAQYTPEALMHPTEQTARDGLLNERLRGSTVIFVGDTLNDAAVQASLATTKYEQRRYALVLQPPLDVPGDDLTDSSRADEQQYVAREIVSRRFLHLGVVPIIADHAHHIPQFLREVGLRTTQGAEDYIGYSERSELWWNYWAKDFGYKQPDGTPGERTYDLQAHWHNKTLKTAMKHLVETLTQENSSALGEQLLMEVWLRNPHARELMLWARSDSLLLDSATTRRASLLSASPHMTKKTFESGIADGERLRLLRGKWRYCWSLPLVLYEEPWYHLPVGVLNVLSNLDDQERTVVGAGRKRTRLHAWAKPTNPVDVRDNVPALEERLKGVILKQLDPRTATWKQRPKWGPYWEKARPHSAASRKPRSGNSG